MSADAKWLRQVASNWWCEGGDGSMFEEVAARIEFLEKAMDDMRLTAAEIEAVAFADAYIHQTGCRNTSVQKTLRGLLERTSATRATPAQGSVQGQ
jgi:hypothetical protein